AERAAALQQQRNAGKGRSLEPQMASQRWFGHGCLNLISTDDNRVTGTRRCRRVSPAAGQPAAALRAAGAAAIRRSITSSVDITSPKMRRILARLALCSSSVAAALASETMIVL